MKSALLLVAVSSLAAQAAEEKIVQVDALGNQQYQKQQYVITAGKKIVPIDSLGNRQYHKQQHVIIKDKICPIDTLGNVQHHKPCLTVVDRSQNLP